MTYLVIVLAVSALVAYVLPPYLQRRERQRFDRRLAAVFPASFAEASRSLCAAYASTPHGRFFTAFADHYIDTIFPGPTTATTPEEIVREHLTRKLIRDLHIYFPLELRTREIPSFYFLPSPVFDSFSQPIVDDSGTTRTVAVFNPLLLMSLKACLSMYMAMVGGTSDRNFRKLVIAGFVGIIKHLTIPTESSAQRVIYDIALFQRLHSASDSGEAAREEHGYKPSHYARDLIADCYHYIQLFMAGHECAHHFKMHPLNATMEHLDFLPRPAIVRYRHASLETEADALVCSRILGLDASWSVRDNVDAPTFYFSVRFYLNLLELIDGTARLYDSPRYSGTLSPRERLDALQDIIAGQGHRRRDPTHTAFVRKADDLIAHQFGVILDSVGSTQEETLMAMLAR